MMTQMITKDLVEAAYLWLQDDVSFARVTRQPGGGQSIYFVFESDVLSDGDIADLRRMLYNQQALVEPKMFMARMVDVKNILHTALRGGKV